MLGEGLQAHRLENLSRYVTHLDCKLERTLAMAIYGNDKAWLFPQLLGFAKRWLTECVTLKDCHGR